MREKLLRKVEKCSVQNSHGEENSCNKQVSFLPRILEATLSDIVISEPDLEIEDED